MTDTIKILVCGAAAVGKSSLINLLIDENFCENNENFMPNKRQFKEFACLKNEKKFIFTEIIGFDTSDKSWMYYSVSEYKLMQFLKQLNDGFNLVIHVQKKQSISETDQVNYELIVNDNFKKRIKTLCVISFAEEEENLEDFWKTNRKSVIDRGFNYDDGVAVCCGHVRNKSLDALNKEQRKKSYNLLWNSILKLTHDSENIKPSFSLAKTIIYDYLLILTDNFVTNFLLINEFLKNIFFPKNIDLDDFTVIDKYVKILFKNLNKFITQILHYLRQMIQSIKYLLLDQIRI